MVTQTGVSFPVAAVFGIRTWIRKTPAKPGTKPAVANPQSVQACHDLLGAAPAHTEELPDRLAVEVRGFDGPQGGEDFFK